MLRQSRRIPARLRTISPRLRAIKR